MQPRDAPALGPRYWTAISLASVFGANLGDVVSHDLHLGHVRGLAPLAVLFAAILVLERRAKAGGEAHYWLAIVVVRTAATNLADLATHDLRLGYGWVILALAGLLAVFAALNSDARAGDALPATNGLYWAAMLIAGTLGTAIGDAVADDVGLGVVVGSLALSAALGALLWARSRTGFGGRSSYWTTIVGVRSAGTTIGDLSAHTLGLAPSAVCSGIVFAATLLLWRKPRSSL